MRVAFSSFGLIFLDDVVRNEVSEYINVCEAWGIALDPKSRARGRSCLSLSVATQHGLIQLLSGFGHIYPTKPKYTGALSGYKLYLMLEARRD